MTEIRIRVLPQARIEAFTGQTNWASTAVPTLAIDADGEEWRCRCGSVLATGMHPEGLLDTFLQCGACGRYSETPRRPPGTPFSSVALVLPTRLSTTETITSTSNIQIVASKTRQEYFHEVGFEDISPVTGFGAMGSESAPWPSRRTGSSSRLDGVSLRASALTLQNYLGRHYPRLLARLETSMNSATPATHSNRVIELIYFARTLARTLDSAPGHRLSHQDIANLTEMTSLLHFSERWRNHPAWPTLLQTLSSVTEVPHTIASLAVASFLLDIKQTVGIHFEKSADSEKLPDLWLRPSLLEVPEMEVKTPQALRNPKLPLTHRQAEKVIGSALKRAQKQLHVGKTSILVLAGYNLGTTATVLRNTAERYVDRLTGKKQLAALIILNIGYSIEPAGIDERAITPQVGWNVIVNDRYEGDLQIKIV